MRCFNQGILSQPQETRLRHLSFSHTLMFGFPNGRVPSHKAELLYKSAYSFLFLESLPYVPQVVFTNDVYRISLRNFPNQPAWKHSQ